MDWFTSLATYAIIWWLVILMVLPWGIRRIEPEDLREGDDAGAPEKPRMLMKVAVTTGISGVIFGLVYLVVISGVISFRV